MSSLTVEEDQKWLPTHVQVTVLRGRGLRGKGKHGTSDVYTIIQLAKEKYSTCVAEKTTEPEWREECSFELQPGVLEGGGGGGGRSSGCPAGSNELVLIVMHRALIGLDVFLGQAVVQLDKVFHETRCVRNEWYKLNSKSGKKEKERGEIQVTVQFTRNNLTASMYDLVMKDKGASTFSKLKERIKGKRRASEEDSASASGYGSLHRMRQRLPSDGGGEEDYEDDEGGEARRSKMRTFFLRGKLRKSSDTRSSTSLGSESSESSRGGSLSPTAGISVVVSDLSNSPSNSSNLTADNSPDHDTSSLQCEFGDGEISIAVPQPTVCVNGSHAYGVRPPDPGSGKPSNALGPLQKSLPLSVSLQNLRPSDPIRSPAGDGRRWSFDKPGEEEKAAIAAALEKSGPMLGDEELAAVAASSSSSESQGKKQGLNSHGRRESEGKGQTQSRDESEQATHKGWFGSKESHSKPSLVVSPKLEPSTDPHHAPGPPVVDPDPLLSPLHHTNPFCPSQTTPPPLSPCNPFFSLLQHNPFYDNTLTAQPLKPPPPPLPYLSSARPPIAQLFPPAHNPDPTPSDWKRPLPPAPLEGELDSEWDESFEAFAAGRLQSPEDLTAECKTQPNTPGDRPLERCSNTGASLPLTDQNTNVNDALRHPPRTEFGFDADRAVVQATNAYHVDAFPQLLETIPEHASFESDAIASNAFTNSPKPDACAESDRANAATNAINSADTNTHEAPRHASPAKLSSSSPDPGSSGIGSSAEEDILSCLSSYSDKFSASSSEEAEAHNLESNVLGFEKSSDSSVVKSKSDDDIADLSSGDVAQQTVIQHSDDDDEADSSGLGGSTAWQPAELTVSATGTGSEDANLSNSPSLAELQPKSMTCLQTEHENGEKGICDFNGALQDLSKMLNDSSLGSTHPSLHIITSSPDVRQSLWDSPIEGTTLGGPDANRRSPVPFGPFDHNANSPNRHFEDTPSGPSRLSDRSASSSFFQSLYVSTDSQDYQTCGSHPSSKSSSGSEPNWTLHSANSTLCGERSDGRTTPADGRGESCGEGINQTDRSEGSVCGAEDVKANLEPSFTTVDDFRLLPVAPTDTYMSCNLRKLTDFGAVLSKCPPAPNATLHRTQSEGALTAAFDELLLPSFGSDPGAIQESSSAKPRPHLPSLTSFALPLKPQSSSSPVALCSLSSLANATPRSPPVPNPMLQETPPPQQQQAANQQAANQQISPHPVKPLTTATEEKRSEGRSVLATGLEKLKSTIHPGRSSHPSEQETDRKKTVTQGAGSYYHLNHSQLVSLLVQREAELARQRAEFERQKLVLAKREVELRKLKPQVKDLEDYIDTLLVRIMEQKPTLLQVRSKLK